MDNAHRRIQRKYILAAALIFAYILFYSNLVSAQLNVTSDDTIQLWVTVAEKTMVDIQPDELGWMGIDPGTETADADIVGWPSKKSAVQIENIGSTNISYIWFNNTYPSSLPFGAGLASAYDAGNFAVVRKNTSGATFFFPNRVEYNESELIYLQLSTPDSDWAHGRFRSANHEYFWAVNTSTGNCSAAEFRIGKRAHNQSDAGSIDLRVCDNGLTAELGNDCRRGVLQPTALTPYTGNDMWGWSDVYIGPDGANENYTVAVHWNCSSQAKVMFYHWDMDAPGAQEGATHPEYFKDNSTLLKPGEHSIANVHLRVPYGTAAGNITGELTVIVQALNVGG